MKFGKFRGIELSELPNDYLNWLRENVELREPLRGAVFSELEARDLLPEPKSGDMKKVKQIYRELSLQFHPDRIGGDGEAQKALNLFLEKLTGRKQERRAC
jgi:hypothetical protein